MQFSPRPIQYRRSKCFKQRLCLVNITAGFRRAGLGSRASGYARDCISNLNTASPEITPEAIVADTIERLDEITTGQIPHTLRAVSIGHAGRDALEQLSAVMQGNSAAVGVAGFGQEKGDLDLEVLFLL
jgi:hypothetical protein